MNEFERDEFSDEPEGIMSEKNADGPLDYCDICFIAFGSQEKRVFVGENVVHLDCAKKAASKKTV